MTAFLLAVVLMWAVIVAWRWATREEDEEREQPWWDKL